RSHYEDVVAVRMLELAPEEVWRRRPGHIAAWERMLVDEGTAIVKVFLHVSKDEQARRVPERLDHPQKRWEVPPAGPPRHARYDAYLAAWEEVVEQTSTEWAPWHVVPADRNWFKALATAELLAHALEQLDPELPEPDPEIAGLRIA